MKNAQKQLIAKRLMEIEKLNNGVLTPAAVVEDAKNPESILHEHFEWNDQEAGYKFRLEQARNLISSVKVVIHTETTAISAVYYVRDPEAKSNEQGYVSLETLRSDVFLARESVVNEFARASACLQRARTHAAALGLEDQVESLLSALDGMRARVKQEHELVQ
jgi:hypothetical protein